MEEGVICCASFKIYPQIFWYSPIQKPKLNSTPLECRPCNDSPLTHGMWWKCWCVTFNTRSQMTICLSPFLSWTTCSGGKVTTTLWLLKHPGEQSAKKEFRPSAHRLEVHPLAQSSLQMTTNNLTTAYDSWDTLSHNHPAKLLNEMKCKPFSWVWLCATPWTMQSVEFSRPGYWG